MDHRNKEYESHEDDDRTRTGKFVDILEHVDIETMNLCVGKVISDKHIKSSVVHNVLQQARGRYAGVRVQEITGEVILFKFDKEEDLKDALDWCPWAIQGNCLSLKRWQQGMRITDVQFNMLQFWVQIHELELHKFNKQNSERIKESMGNVLEVDDIMRLMGLDRNFVRIKAEIDIMKPLPA